MSQNSAISSPLVDRLKSVALPVILLTLLTIALFEQSPGAADTAFWAPGGVYGDNWDSVKYEPFSGGRWGLSFSLLLCSHFFLTHLIGYQMIRPWLAMSRVPFAAKVCASFFPGYLALAGINRVTNLLLPNTFAPTVCVGLSILLYWILSRHNKSQEEPLSRLLASHWKQISGLAAIYAISIVLHIQWGRNFMVSDSTGNTFLPILTQLIQKLEEIRYFPIVDQQYDEFAYSYPLNFLPPGRSLLIVPYWWLASVGKIALGASLWVIFSPIQKTRLSLISLMGAPFILLSGLIPNPLKYVELTGCMLPILDSWHIGRLLGPILPFAIICLFFEKSPQKPSLLTALLLGLGIGTTSIHNALFASGTVALGVLWFYIKPFRIPQPLWRISAIAAAAVTLLLILFTYASGNAAPAFYNGWPLVIGSLLSSAGILIRPQLPDASEPVEGPVNRPTLHWLMLVAGIGFAMCLLGNMPSTKTIAAARSAIPSTYLPGGYSLTINRASSLANIDAPKQYFRFTGNRSPSKHATSFKTFLGYYGLLFVAGFTLLCLWAFTPATHPDAISSQYPLQLLLLFTATLALAFFCVDFILDAVLPWIKYRLIEIPFIGILVLLIQKLDTDTSRRSQFAIATILACWSIPGFISHAPIEQLGANIKYWLHFL